jgi:hypothetical protein
MRLAMWLAHEPPEQNSSTITTSDLEPADEAAASIR